MKKIFFLFTCLLLLATGCATQKTTPSRVENIPVYHDGNDKPAAMAVFRYSDEQ